MRYGFNTRLESPMIVQSLDSGIQQISHYLTDECTPNLLDYPVDTDYIWWMYHPLNN